MLKWNSITKMALFHKKRCFWAKNPATTTTTKSKQIFVYIQLFNHVLEVKHTKKLAVMSADLSYVYISCLDWRIWLQCSWSSWNHMCNVKQGLFFIFGFLVVFILLVPKPYLSFNGDISLAMLFSLYMLNIK